MALEDARAGQWARLRSALPGVLKSNRFHQERFRRSGLSLDDLKTPADIGKIPFTAKGELAADQQAHPPFGSNLTHPPAHYCRQIGRAHV